MGSGETALSGAFVAIGAATADPAPAGSRLVAVCWRAGAPVATACWSTDADDPQAVAAAWAALTAGLPWVAHDLEPSRTVLAAAVARGALPEPEILWSGAELARLVFPTARSHRLLPLAAELGLPPPEPAANPPGAAPPALDAAGAASLTGAVFAHCLHRLRSMELAVVEAVLRLAPPVGGVLPLFGAAAAELRRHGGRLRPPLEWISPSAQPLHGDGPARPAAPAAAPPDPAAVAAILGPAGAIADQFPNYEHRPQQMDLAHQVAAAFRDGLHLLAEAGTGTGKSLAYLVPALLWAANTGERVVVSTHTITLQEQLWQKDLPFVNAALDLDRVPIALVKGRNHYICLRKWEEQLARLGLADSDAERAFHARMVTWLAETDSGDRAELGVQGGEEDGWRQVMSDTDTCIGARCKWHARHCFAFRARRQARDALLLVANHSLVLADRKTGGQVLPPYRYLVVDEAHHLEAVATDQLGCTIAERDLHALLSHLVRGPHGPGLLAGVRRRWPQPLPARAPVGQPGDDLLTLLADLAPRARLAADILCRSLAGVVEALAGAEEDPRQLRLTEAVFLDPLWSDVELAAANAIDLLRLLAEGMGQLGEELDGLDPRPDDIDSTLVEVQSLAGQLRQTAFDLESILAAAAPGMVYWLEAAARPGNGARLTLRSAPVHVGHLLRAELWDNLHGAALLSATLAVGGSFAHAQSRLGLAELPADRLATALIPSPFAYPEQALVLIPSDLPNPNAPTFAAAVSAFLGDLLPRIGGRALVLFTSHRQLQTVYNDLKEPLTGANLRPLAQGLDGNRGRLLDEFRGAGSAVLFGSASFWEGVDLPGEQLSCVVLVRLPFAPPTHPVQAARGEDLERRGRSRFFHLALPEAILRFKQGFGRLIRTRTDRGIVIVLDGRIHPAATRYGRQFLQALPGPRLLAATSPEICQAAAAFLRKEDPTARPADQR